MTHAWILGVYNIIFYAELEMPHSVVRFVDGHWCSLFLTAPSSKEMQAVYLSKISAAAPQAPTSRLQLHVLRLGLRLQTWPATNEAGS